MYKQKRKPPTARRAVGKPLKRPEETLQIHLSEWLRKVELKTKAFLFFHVPNGGYRTEVEAKKFYAMGARAGVPDEIICLNGGRVLFIELKPMKQHVTKDHRITWQKAGSISPEQDKMHVALRALGYRVDVLWCKHGVDAIEQVAAILKQEGVDGKCLGFYQ